jgi:hypothetical protein
MEKKRGRGKEKYVAVYYEALEVGSNNSKKQALF